VEKLYEKMCSGVVFLDELKTDKIVQGDSVKV
jgi:hypothetical protein